MENRNSISPLDGRYFEDVKDIEGIFSEDALNKKRVYIEIEYLITFCETVKIKIPGQALKKIYINFSDRDSKRIKQIEKTTQHDIGAIIEFVKEKTNKDTRRFVHFGLTSEDVNNLAYGLMLREAVNVYLDTLKTTILQLTEYASEYKHDVMLSHTHGEPATPTTVGKECANYAVRLATQYKKLKQIKIQGKLTGATGNFNALCAIYPEVDWITFSKNFVRHIGLAPTLFSTQILFTDSYAELFDTMKRINSILIDLNRNIWLYFLLGYLSLKTSKESMGSSTMPHKINPIFFENSEGNAEIAENLFEFFSKKLLKSRLQRDLTDSTVKRNLGVAFGHSLLSVKSLKKGLEKIVVDKEKIEKDLEAHQEILSELVQLSLRKQGEIEGYKEIKEKTRGKKTVKEALLTNIQEKKRETLISQYLSGKAEELVDAAIKTVKKDLT